MAIRGNTVKLRVVFEDDNGNAVNPSGSVALVIRDSIGTQLVSTTIPLGSAVATGTFVYDYLVPDVEGFTYQFSATVDGVVELGRAEELVTEI